MEMKLSGFCSLFFIATSGMMPLSSASVNYSHTMILSTETANQGDSMTASCTIKSDSKVSVMVIWQKKTIGEKKLVEIATNIFINTDFGATNRYFGENVDNSTNTTSNVMFSLKITDLKSEDSGYFACKPVVSTIPSEEPKDFKLFTVLVPIQKIWWTSFNDEIPLPDGYTETIKEGDNHTFGCHVNGSFPNAEVQVLLGNQDVTHLFEVNSALKKSHGPKGLHPLYYRTDAISKSNIIGYHSMTKSLRCIAKLPNSDLSAETTINVNMTEYSPTFLCKNKMRAKLHETYFKLTCKVYANPSLKSVRFHWFSDNSNSTLDAGEKNNDLTTEMSTGDVKDEVILVMTISRVTQQHFDREYIFDAQNDVKRVKHIIHLERDTSLPITLPGGSMSLSLKKSLLLLLLYSVVCSLP